MGLLALESYWFLLCVSTNLVIYVVAMIVDEAAIRGRGFELPGQDDWKYDLAWITEFATIEASLILHRITHEGAQAYRFMLSDGRLNCASRV